MPPMNREAKIKEFKIELEILAQKYLRDRQALEARIKEEIPIFKIGDETMNNESSYNFRIDSIRVDSFGEKFSIKYWGRRLKKNGEPGLSEDWKEEKF